MTKSIQHRIEYLIIRLMMLVFNLLPVKAALFFGEILGFVTFSVLRVRRRVSLVNLKKSFGDRYTDREYRRIARRSYINFTKSMIEFGLFSRLAKRDLTDFIEIINAAPLTDNFKAGRGAVIVSGHFGSFELMGACMAQLGWPIDFLVGRQHNLLVNRLMNRNRSLFGVGLIEIGVAARGVFSALKKGRGVVMLSDQDAGRDGVIIDFLGRPASTPKGPAAFALKTGCPVFVFIPIRDGAFHHKLYFTGPLAVEPSGNKDEDIKRLTQAYSDVIAEYITRYPVGWFWAHRRWKSTFPDDYR